MTLPPTPADHVLAELGRSPAPHGPRPGAHPVGARIHEARILASMVDDPAQVTEEQMDAWVADFDPWDRCDQVCGNLFDATSE